MVQDLFISLLERMSVVATIAFVMTRSRIFHRLLHRKASRKEKALLAMVFGLVGVLGTYTGIPVQGALANSRVIGPLAGGLLGGPLVGLGAGLLAGGHRYLIGGFTALSCGLSTLVEGGIGGLVYLRYGRRVTDWRVAFWAGLAAETVQMAIILLIARPFSAAWGLVQVIGLPMILVNAAGTAIFVAIIHSVVQEQERAGAVQAQKALQIADLTLPYLRQGLNPESAALVARIILDTTKVAAVAITDRERILVHVGAGEDHHLPGRGVLTQLTQKVLATGEYGVAENRIQVGCSYEGCSLNSAVIVPLKRRDEVIGALKLYHTGKQEISSIELEFACGLARLFSTQLEAAEGEKQQKLRADAEIRALQAQINPHFLFNVLNTVVSFCRTDPETARRLLLQIGEFFRQNLQRGNDLVALREEIKHVDTYLAIEQARFGHRLKVVHRIDPGAEDARIPALSIQPLVENAVLHGLLPKRGGGTVEIEVASGNGEVCVRVKDDGVGIPPETLEGLLKEGSQREGKGLGIGLRNVHERLKSLYGSQYGLVVKSSVGLGTKIEMRVPQQEAQHGNHSMLCCG